MQKEAMHYLCICTEHCSYRLNGAPDSFAVLLRCDVTTILPALCLQYTQGRIKKLCVAVRTLALLPTLLPFAATNDPCYIQPLRMGVQVCQFRASFILYRAKKKEIECNLTLRFVKYTYCFSFCTNMFLRSTATLHLSLHSASQRRAGYEYRYKKGRMRSVRWQAQGRKYNSLLCASYGTYLPFPYSYSALSPSLRYCTSGGMVQ